MPAITMNSAQFRTVVDPILSQVFDGVYKENTEYDKYMTEITGIASRVHYEPILASNTRAAPVRSEGSATTYMGGQETVVANYVYKVRALAFAITQEMMDDGTAINFSNVYTQHMAMAMKEAKELACVAILNNSQTTNLADGVPLLSASHPTPTGVQSNLLPIAAALSYTSVGALCNIVALTKSDAGQQIGLQAQKLLVPVALQFEAETIVNSALRSGTANNDINAIKSRGYLKDGVVALSRLTSSTGYYVKTNAPRGMQLVVHPKGKLKKTMEGDFETDSMRYKMSERYEPGVTNWRAVVGTPGL